MNGQTPAPPPNPNPANPDVVPNAEPIQQPPDDFGAQLVAEFERRTQQGEQLRGEVAAEPPTGDPGVGAPDPSGGEVDAPPGGWPDGPGTADDAAVVPGPAATPGATPATPGAVDDPAAVTDLRATDPTSAADDPAAADAADPAADPAATPASGYTWRGVNQGQDVTFTDEQVQQAIGLASWAENLSPELRVAFTSIENGQAVAIARSEYDQFLAWHQQQSRTSRDGDLDALADPDTAKLIASLRDEIAELRGYTGQAGIPVQQPVPQQAPQYAQPAPGYASGYAQPGAVSYEQNANLQANMDETARRFEAAVSSYGQARGLSPEELDHLTATAVQSQIVPTLMQQHTRVNPVNGALLQAPDIGRVTEQALDYALLQNPELHTRVLNAQQAASHAQNTATTPPPEPSDPVLAKRARASSLASAPSAAVATPPRSPETLSTQETVSAMAAEIEAALARAQ